MEKIVENGMLYDFYGSLLTKHQQKIYEDAVYNDMSLTEIAETEGISRQAVSDLLRRTTALMQKYEKELGLVQRFERIRGNCDRILEAAKVLEQMDAGEGADAQADASVPSTTEALARDLQENVASILKEL